MLRLLLNGNTNAGVFRTAAFVRFQSFQLHPENDVERQPIRERSGVTICGKISGTPTILENGLRFITLLTRNTSEETHTRHQILATPSILKNVAADSLADGARIYVTGVLKYSSFESADGFQTEQGQIVSSNIILCDKDESPSGDINEVNLVGSVKYKPDITENVTFLKVVTRSFDRKLNDYTKSYHQVMIKDDEHMRQQATVLGEDAEVFIHGYLHTRPAQAVDGNMRGIYYIRPRQLVIRKLGSNESAK